MKKSQLEVSVIAHNAMARFFPIARAAKVAHFSKFIGKSIFKVNGSLMEKCKETNGFSFDGMIEDGTTHCSVQTWVSLRNYSSDAMYLTVKICVNGGSYDDNSYFCQYLTETSDIFKYDGTLGAECTPYFPASFDLEAIKAAAKEAIEAAKVYESAMNKVPYQFRGLANVQRLTNS